MCSYLFRRYYAAIHIMLLYLKKNNNNNITITINYNETEYNLIDIIYIFLK